MEKEQDSFYGSSDHDSVNLKRGIELFKSGKYLQAQMTLAAAEELKDEYETIKYAKGLFWMAKSFVADKEFQKAFRCFVRLMTVAIMDEDMNIKLTVLMEVGLAYLSWDKPENAIETFEKLLLFMKNVTDKDIKEAAVKKFGDRVSCNLIMAIFQQLACHKSTPSLCSDIVAKDIPTHVYFIKDVEKRRQGAVIAALACIKLKEHHKAIKCLSITSVRDEDTLKKVSSVIKEYAREKAESYYMRNDKDKTGKCIIFSNRKYADGRVREGTKEDEDSLVETFKKLNFTTQINPDVESKQLLDELKGIAEGYRDRYDAFVCCILSHGSLGRISCSDEKSIAEQEIRKIFGSSRCPQLRGKPKIFLIQACRENFNTKNLTRQDSIDGRDFDGIHFDDDGSNGKRYEEQESIDVPDLDVKSMDFNDVRFENLPPQIKDEIFKDLESIRSDVLTKRQIPPEDCDFFIGHATTPGNLAVRDPTEGSWFIQSFCKNLNEHASTKSLSEISRLVKAEVSNRPEYSVTPDINDTLRKNLYFCSD